MVTAGGQGAAGRRLRASGPTVAGSHPAGNGTPDSSVTGGSTCAFLISSRRRHTRLVSDWSSDVCSSDVFCLRSEERRVGKRVSLGGCRIIKKEKVKD